MAKLNWRLISKYLGLFSGVIGAIIGLSFTSLLFYPSDMNQVIYFLMSMGVAFGCGFLLYFPNRKVQPTILSLGDDAIIVVLTWLTACFYCALPFVFSNILGFSQAYFEAMSGWTTTGLTMVNLDILPKIYIMYRSIIQFFGGVGIVLVISSALSSTFGFQLYQQEGHSETLVPNLLKSSRMIMYIYSGYVIMGVILYVVFGMPLFDAINHSMAALSTGGFNVYTSSLGYYNSVSLEVITIILMLLGTTNFVAHLVLISGRFKAFFRYAETKMLFFLLGVTIPLLAFVGLNALYQGMGMQLRMATFQAVSAVTTTGFSTVDFAKWNQFSNMIIISLMFIGGGIGSTSGGLKLYRFYLMIKSFLWSIKDKLKGEHHVHEHTFYKPTGKVFVDEGEVSSIYRYAFIYSFIYILGVFVLVMYRYPLLDSMFEIASALGTVGLSIGLTQATMPVLAIWTETVLMLVGRLEILVFFVAFYRLVRMISNKKY